MIAVIVCFLLLVHLLQYLDKPASHLPEPIRIEARVVRQQWRITTSQRRTCASYYHRALCATNLQVHDASGIQCGAFDYACIESMHRVYRIDSPADEVHKRPRDILSAHAIHR